MKFIVPKHLRRLIISFIIILVLCFIKTPKAPAISLNGTWNVSAVQKVDIVPSYINDPFYQQGWQNGQFFNPVIAAPVPLNIFWQWTGRSPCWSPSVLNVDNPLDGMLSMWSFGQACKNYYDGHTNIVVWYRRYFTLNSIDPSKKLFLEFSGVATESQVFVNGTYVGRHHGSHTSFKLDITNAAITGSNLVAVRCIVPLGTGELTEWAHSIHHYAGIWRGVAVNVKDVDSIDHVLIDPDPINHRLFYRIWLYNNASTSLTLDINIIDDATGSVVASSNGSIAAGVKKPSPFNMNFSGELWSHDSPKLYRMQVILRRSGLSVDVKETTFGFRSVALQNNKLLLNGSPIQMLGYGEDGNFFGGEGYSNSQVKDRYKALIQAYKNKSANAVRWHNPCIQEQIDASDSLGFLIYQGWHQSVPMAARMGIADYENYLTEYILQNYNHPSIIAWHLANELWENGDVSLHNDHGYDIAKPLDTSGRPVVPDSGSYSFPQLGLPGISSSLDIVDMHNYAGVSFKALGEPQRRPFTQVARVVQEAINETCEIFGSSNLPFMLGESADIAVWTAFDEANWGPANPDHGQGIYYRKPIGPDNLVRTEFFEEIKEYDQPSFGIGHGVKHEGFVNYIGNPGVDAGDLKSWTDAEVVKYCNEQYRLMPLTGIHINDGRPSTDILSDSLLGITRDQIMFSPILAIASNLPRQLFAGEQVSFTVSVDNKTMNIQTGLKLTTRLVDASTHTEIFESAAVTLPTIINCSYADVAMSLTPPVSFTGKAIVRLLVHTGDPDSPISENFYYVSVCPQTYNQTITQNKTLTVWQPGNRNIASTKAILDDLGLNYQIATTSDILSGLKKSDWLLIAQCAVFGPNGRNTEWDSIMLTVEKDVKMGMNLLVLEQLGTGDLGLGEGMQYRHVPGNVTADPTVWDHPVLTNVPWHKWWIWRGNDGDIAPYVIDIGRTTLATIGAHFDDELYSVLAEGKLATGRLILSQPDAVSRWRYDAAATLYLRELLNYMVSGNAWPRSRSWTAIDHPAEVFKFQYGTDVGEQTYDGTVDSYPKENSPTAYGSHSGYNTMYIRTTGGGIGISSLIKWADIENYLPTDLPVQSARIGLTIQSPVHGLDISIAQMLKPWNGSALNWLIDGMGNSWAAAGAQGSTANGGIPADRALGNLDTVVVSATAAAGDILWFDVMPSVVQGWIDNPASNHGVLVYGSNQTQANWMIALSGVTEGLINGFNQRPILEVSLGQEPVYCGDSGTWYLPTDFNKDCYTNLEDYAIFAELWLKCPNIADPNCNDPFKTNLGLFLFDWLKCTDPVNLECNN